VRVADRRSVGSMPPYARGSRWSCYGGIFVITAASPGASPIKPERCSPLLPPPLPRRRAIRAAAVELRPPCFPRSSKRAHPSPRPFRTLRCHLLFGPSPRRRRSRGTAAAPSVSTVRPRRRDLRPDAGHPQALGEPADMPRRFPGRERGRLAGIWPAPQPPMAKGRIASPLLVLGCFS
jgi:hypothetical protein